MELKTVIELDDNIQCLVLDEYVYENIKYLYVNILKENDEPGDEFYILIESVEDGETYYEILDDEQTKAKLLVAFLARLNARLDNE